jgi:hypothetical protein
LKAGLYFVMTVPSVGLGVQLLGVSSTLGYLGWSGIPVFK